MICIELIPIRGSVRRKDASKTEVEGPIQNNDQASDDV